MSSASHPAPTPTRVVVVGAGYAGVAAAKSFVAKSRAWTWPPWASRPSVDVTIVSDRPFVYHKMGGLRAAVAGGTWVDRAMIPLEDVGRSIGARVVVQRVVGVDRVRRLVEVANGDAIEYDVLVLAVGSRARGVSEPDTRATRPEDAAREFRDHFRGALDAVRSARSVVVVGGGAVGVELTGEIRAMRPAGAKRDDELEDVRVTLVTGKLGLLGSVQPAFPNSFKEDVRGLIASHRVSVVSGVVASPPFDDRAPAVRPADGHVVLDSGERIPADVVLFATGADVASRTAFLPREWISAGTGEIRVDEHYRVEGETHVFALGDAAASGVPKMAAFTANQADVVAANALDVVVGREPRARFEPPRKAQMLLPFGAGEGRMILPNGWVLGDFASARIKGRGLFANTLWRTVVGRNAPDGREADVWRAGSGSAPGADVVAT